MGNTWGGNENKGSPGKRDRPECDSSETERGTGNKEKLGKGGERGEDYECDNDIEDNIVKETAGTRKGEREKEQKVRIESVNVHSLAMQRTMQSYTRKMKKQEFNIHTGRDGELDIKKGMIGTRKQRMKQKQGTERIELG